jgi:guanidinopropionase
MRGHRRSLTAFQDSHELGYSLRTIRDIRTDGLLKTAELLRERVSDASVYVTFDLDCLDPTIAPAVSNVEVGEGGFLIDEVNLLLRALDDADVVGGDVVCLMPTKDGRGSRTAMVAAHIAFELISLIALGVERKRS